MFSYLNSHVAKPWQLFLYETSLRENTFSQAVVCGEVERAQNMLTKNSSLNPCLEHVVTQGEFLKLSELQFTHL